MLSIKIGFIGCGNMAKAMIRGILSAKAIDEKNIFASARRKEELEKVEKIFGIKTTTDNKEVVKNSDIIILSVKPNTYKSVMHEISAFCKNKIIVSIAPGWTLKSMAEILGKDSKILRTMPNTPAMVGAGVTAICPNENINKEEYEILKQIFSTFGTVEEIEEKLFDVIVGISGSSPAYMYMFIEAMADAGVLCSMPRDKAYRIAAQSMIGSAKMVLESGKHPAELKDMVCSPGGTTIEGVAMLEKMQMRSAVIETVKAVVEKSEKMKI